MKRSTLAGSVAAVFCLGFATTLLAAQPAATGTVKQLSSSEKKVAAIKPAEKCFSDLRGFDDQMSEQGYWLGGSGYGYGYPMAGFGFGPPMMVGSTEEGGATAYQNARPGYELRTLLSAAGILARQGQQQPCEDVLAASRGIYKVYVADLHSGKMSMANLQSWRQQQIAAAQPVTATNTATRSDELIGTEVRSPQNGALGSVDDLMRSPKTGTIDYVIIARGGLFGIDEKYVPVPWAAFKISPNLSLLVLGSTKDALATAPQASKEQFATPGQFVQVSQKVDAYWKTHLSDNGKD